MKQKIFNENVMKDAVEPRTGGAALKGKASTNQAQTFPLWQNVGIHPCPLTHLKLS